MQQSICTLTQMGVPVVAAAGNDGTDANYSAPGGYDQVITVADGRPGSIMEGSRGLMRLDLEAESVFSLRSPAAPTLDPNAEPKRIIASAYGNESSQEILVALDSRRGRTRGLNLQPITESVAKSEAQLVFPGDADLENASAETIIRIGDRTIVLLQGEELDHLYVLHDDSGKTIARKVVDAPRGTILPQSVNVERTGAWIAYIKNVAPGRRELWIASGNDTRQQPSLLTLGDLGERVAFSSDAQLVAYSTTDRGGRHMIHTIHVSSLRDVPDIGEGRIIENGWNHNDGMIYAIAPTADGTRQLTRMKPSGDDREQLTDFPNGLGPVATLSPSGGRVVMQLAGDRPRLILLDLSRAKIAATPVTRPANS